MLRTPIKFDYVRWQVKYPRLLIITLHLEKVRPDGMPEPDYNKKLMAMDLSLVRHFEKAKKGSLVLVETFAGKRNYYYYVTMDAEVESEVSKIKAQFPGRDLTFAVKDDPHWQFIQRYPKDYCL